MPYQILSSGSDGGCYLVYAAFCDISYLTCTIFDLGIFLRNSVSNFFHIFSTRLKFSIMEFGLEMAHRGNTCSHKGKMQFFP